MTALPFFSSDAFLEVLADVYFPGARPEVVACEGQRVRVLMAGGRPVSGFWPFPFPLEPLPRKPRARIVPYLADVVMAELPADAPPAPGCVASPLIRWSQFATFAAFEAWASDPPRNGSIAAIKRRTTRIERDLGPVTFLADDSSDGLFESVLAWKSEQYLRGRYPDRFTGLHRRFYEELRARQLLMGSSLRAGGRIIAGHLSNRAEGRLLYRLPSYDYSLAKYSPGAVHLRFLMRDSFERGDRDFDFLVGAEPYKLQFATHIRWLGALGREPRAQRWQRRARWLAAAQLRKHPQAYRLARVAEERARSLIHR